MSSRKASPVYVHTEDVHNLEAAREITPVLFEMLCPMSVVDFGCGIGTFLSAFKELGVDDVLGIDGEWADAELVSKYLDKTQFRAMRLDTSLSLERRFDVAICLEVAEHIPSASAEVLVENLVRASDCIVFSAAIPGQGGQNHINEQWPEYWQVLFAKHSYVFQDVLRARFWENEKVFWWYRQNMFLVTNTRVSPKGAMLRDLSTLPQKLVHPELHLAHVRKLERLSQELRSIKSGSQNIRSATKQFLRCCAGRLGFK